MKQKLELIRVKKNTRLHNYRLQNLASLKEQYQKVLDMTEDQKLQLSKEASYLKALERDVDNTWLRDFFDETGEYITQEMDLSLLPEIGEVFQLGAWYLLATKEEAKVTSRKGKNRSKPKAKSKSQPKIKKAYLKEKFKDLEKLDEAEDGGEEDPGADGREERVQAEDEREEKAEVEAREEGVEAEAGEERIEAEVKAEDGGEVEGVGAEDRGEAEGVETEDGGEAEGVECCQYLLPNNPKFDFNKDWIITKGMRLFHPTMLQEAHQAPRALKPKYQTIVDKLFDSTTKQSVTFREFAALWTQGVGGSIIGANNGGGHRQLVGPLPRKEKLIGIFIFNQDTPHPSIISYLQTAILYVGCRPRKVG